VVVRSLDEGFEQFLDRLTPRDEDVTAAEGLREEIKECLEARFGLYAFFRGGSSLSDTGVRGYSSVDYFASMDEHRMTGEALSFLDRVREVLVERFPRAKVVARPPGVLISGDGEGRPPLKVIPARLVGQTEAGHHIYEIVDGAGGWMYSSPDAHSDYIASTDYMLEGKLKSLIRLLKAWKYVRDVPISSFYLELRCAAYASAEKMIVYSVDLQHLLEQLWEDQLADIQDPREISGSIPGRMARTDRRKVISSLRTALYHISRAQETAAQGDLEEAFRYWNRVFNGHFSPAEHEALLPGGGR